MLKRLVTAAEMRRLDKQATEKYGVSSLLLMEQAAKAVADAAMELLRHKGRKSAAVFCGKGNNGGDGLGAARWLLSYGVAVRVFLVDARPEDYSGDAAAQLEMYIKAGGEPEFVNNEEDLLLARMAAAKAGLLIDAMLGTGFSGSLRGLVREVCRLLNATEAEVLSVDIPSGVNADDGSADEDAVCAGVTVTMALAKTGLLLYPGKEKAGRVLTAAIGMPRRQLEDAENFAGNKYLLTASFIAGLLPRRAGNAHKGSAGRVLLCAGSPGFTGAAALCAQAAVKSGAGLVTLLTPLASRDVLAIKLTEVMVHGLLERMPGVLGGAAAADILKRAAQSSVLAMGPGLGISVSTAETVRSVLQKTETPVVIDADALTALQGQTELLPQMQAPKVLTPHPGEMARLTGLSIEEIDRDRIAVAAKYAVKWQAVLVLKGAPTVIAVPDGTVYVNSSGASNMASGGCGDVLTGIIAGLAAQGLELTEAALCGVYLHGRIGQRLHNGCPGLAAGEMAALLPEVRQELQQSGGTAADDAGDVCNHALKML